jgi:hypothetical protein
MDGNGMPPAVVVGGRDCQPTPPLDNTDVGTVALPTVRVPAIVTVPVAWMIVPVGTLSVTPPLIVKFVHWIPVPWSVVIQFVFDVILHTPALVPSEPSP